MDAKARTHFCESPLASAQSGSGLRNCHSAYLIMIHGGIPGTMLRIGPDETTLGRSADNTFSLDDMTVSRRHARIKVDAHGVVTLIDQGSTNGTFVNGRRVEAGWPVGLDEGDRLQFGSGVVLKLVRLDASDENFQRQMFERTVRDGLTGVFNRAYFLSQHANLVARHAAQGIGVAMLMVDIDHFKQVNDHHGHLVGDVVLREVAAVLRESTRTEDLVARYGGEEFIVALPSSAADHAVERAERIRVSVAGRRIRSGAGEIHVTASIGVAYGPPQRPVNPIALIQAADEALYRAKSEGRNCVIMGRHTIRPTSKETKSVEVVTSL